MNHHKIDDDLPSKTSGESKDDKQIMKHRKGYVPYLIALVMCIAGWWGFMEFGDSLYALPSAILIFFALGIVVNDQYRREISRGRDE